MITQGGWHTDVWAALTGAPTFNIAHSSTDSNDLFTKIQGWLAKEFAVGAATVSNEDKNLVQGHAYSVLGAYEVTLDNGLK
jgi:hypothetical protein